MVAEGFILLGKFPVLSSPNDCVFWEHYTLHTPRESRHRKPCVSPSKMYECNSAVKTKSWIGPEKKKKKREVAAAAQRKSRISIKRQHLSSWRAKRFRFDGRDCESLNVLLTVCA